MEDSYQATEFDQQTTSHHLQMLKAAVPYMPVSQQKTISFLIKFQELQNAMHIFQSDDGELGICSLSEDEKIPWICWNPSKSTVPTRKRKCWTF